MKVRDAIERLGLYNPDDEVIVYDLRENLCAAQLIHSNGDGRVIIE